VKTILRIHKNQDFLEIECVTETEKEGIFAGVFDTFYKKS
jgi:hypothetical protein